MRVMSYNILEGGDLEAGDRTELLLSVIRSYDPDVLGLCECRGFEKDDGARFRLFKHELDMTGVLSPANGGNSVALLWKAGVRVSAADSSSTLMYNGYARMIADIAGFGPTTITIAHLHPFSSLLRLGELQTILGRSRSTDHAIIAGDFNCVSRSDNLEVVAKASPHLVTRLLGPSAEIDTAPVDMLIRHGLIDLHEGAPRWTYPTPLGGKQARYGCSVRLDYLFATPSLADGSSALPLRCESIALRASDHLPVAVDLRTAPVLTGE